ncbi:hypothetical protein ARMSODRAFT_980798 [Armillaria solidipes]|uniref:Uncharacterized protein n=1 Tax=Armillaria solidipes TaxID=1076256 RepID=A0A2H3BH06_9AGAR|nr:hypothetical protein ARMSODRAFT_980798 [Armillaria solidipes]
MWDAEIHQVSDSRPTKGSCRLEYTGEARSSPVTGRGGHNGDAMANASREAVMQECSLTVNDMSICNGGKLERDGLFMKFPQDLDVSDIHIRVDGWIRRNGGRRYSILHPEIQPTDVLYRAKFPRAELELSNPPLNLLRPVNTYLALTQNVCHRKDIETTLCRRTERIQVEVSGGHVIRLDLVGMFADYYNIATHTSFKNRGHRHKDGKRRSTRNMRVWIANRHRFHQEPEIYGSNSENEDYLAVRRQPVRKYRSSFSVLPSSDAVEGQARRNKRASCHHERDKEAYGLRFPFSRLYAGLRLTDESCSAIERNRSVFDWFKFKGHTYMYFRSMAFASEKGSKDTPECLATGTKKNPSLVRTYPSCHPWEVQERTSDEGLVLLFLSFCDGV